MSPEDSPRAAYRVKDAVFAIGSGATAIGFWGLAIDVALRSYIYQTTVNYRPDIGLWLFSVVFLVGLVAMGVSSLKRVGSRA
jgi:hypothetical protein